MQSGWHAIVGHELPIRFLRTSLERDRLAHALAFVGPKSVGKATVAKVLAQAVLCPEKPHASEPCGNCRTCARVEKGLHPDVHWVAPESSTLGIEQVRNLQAALALKPFESDRKVAVIDDGDAMTIPAQNCLLKVLEEPPGDTVMVVIAANPSALLPTIRSRCQTLRFQAAPIDRVERFVRDRGIHEDRARLVAMMAEGRIGAALAMAEVDVVGQRDTVAGWVEDLSGGEAQGVRAVISIGHALETEKERLQGLLGLLLMWLRDLILVQEGAEDTVANQDVMERLRAQANRLGAHGIAAAMRAVDEAVRRLRSHANVRLALDAMLTDVQRSLSP